MRPASPPTYGSTSAVTYAVANQFAELKNAKPDGYLPTLVTILECPGIAIALALGAALSAKTVIANPPALATPWSWMDTRRVTSAKRLYEVITGQSIMLMANGLLVIGYIADQLHGRKRLCTVRTVFPGQGDDFPRLALHLPAGNGTGGRTANDWAT